MTTFALLVAGLVGSTSTPQVRPIQTFPAIRTVAVAGAPTGSLFAVSEESGAVRIMDADSRQTVSVFQGHKQPCYALAFRPRTNQVVSGDEGAAIKVWNRTTGELVREFPAGSGGHERGIQSITFTADGMTMVTTGKDDVIIIWDFEKGTQRFRLAGNGVVFNSAAISAFGLITGTLTEGIHFRKPGTVELAATVNPTEGINDIAINSVANRMVTAGRDQRVGIWDIKNRRRIASLKAHSDWVQRVAISPNGRLVASSSNDRTVFLWDAKTGRRIDQLIDQSAVGSPLAFTGDGRFLITANVMDQLQLNAVSPAMGLAQPTVRRVRRR